MRIYNGKRKKGRVVERDVHDYHGLKRFSRHARRLRRLDRQEARDNIERELQTRDEEE